MKSETNHICLQKLSFYAAICLFLSAVEFALPHPVPFIRLGLANLPIMLSLEKMSKKETIILAFLKILGQTIISGTLLSYIFLFSAAGTFFSCLTMILIYEIFKKHNLISWIGISLCGAFANNFGQILISSLIIFKENTKLIIPPLLTVSIITGILLGIFANEFSAKSKWFNQSFEKSSYKNPDEIPETEIKNKSFSFKKFLHSLKPSFFIILSCIFFSLFTPSGKILFEYGKIKITSGAIISGFWRGIKLCLSVILSKIIVKSKIFTFKGKFDFINDIFKSYATICSQKIIFKKNNLISSIDEALIKTECSFS